MSVRLYIITRNVMHTRTHAHAHTHAQTNTQTNKHSIVEREKIS